MYDVYTIEAIIIVVRVQTGPHGELFKAIYDDSDRRRVGKRNDESEKKKKKKKKDYEIRLARDPVCRLVYSLSTLVISDSCARIRLISSTTGVYPTV